jgi:hypothetical protein
MKQKRPATIEELAAISFDVWKPGNGEWRPPVDGQDWVIKLTESIPTLVGVRRSWPQQAIFNDDGR